MLCLYCQSIADGWPAWDGSWMTVTAFKHYKSRVELEASAVKGCRLCTQFVRSSDNVPFTPKDDGIGYVEIFSEGGRGWFPQQIPRRWGLELRMASENAGREDITIVAAPTIKPIEISASLRTSLPSTRHGLSRARQWLQTCCKSHKACKSGSPNYIPTRLIDISNEPYLRLFDSTSDPVEYATLSHCWGLLQLPTLTKGSFIHFRNRIPAPALSKTFCEAIETARFLGLRYIWIDSLCIIQDDADDWYRESRLMASIYGSSTVNIAASASADGRGGCFFERDPIYGCTFMDPRGMFIECFDRWFTRNLKNMPLITRGWALQERLLPHRNLFMVDTEIFWQCLTSEACETLPEFPERPLKNFSSGFEYLCFDGRIAVCRENWHPILKQYMKCQITKSQDKLVAVAGVAKSIHDKTGHSYVAGLWLDDIEAQLCWETVSEPYQSKIFDYRAPSWSWASTDAGVDWKCKGKIIARVDSAHVDYDPPGDSFGAILFASLKIESHHILKLNMRIDDDKLKLKRFQFSHNDIKIGIDMSFDGTNSWGTTSEYEMYLIPLLLNSDNEWEGTSARIRGLLACQSGQERGRYRRIGLFKGLRSDTLYFMETYLRSPEVYCGDESLFSEIKTLEDGCLEKFIILV